MDFIQLILHLDIYLIQAVNTYHTYFYLILFLVIFCETGLVVTPFLPGDSLLFIAGSIAANDSLDLSLLAITIIVAAFCGDNSNYVIGRFLGNKLFTNPKSKIFRKDILDKTHDFYGRHGRKTVILARFMPFIRTFAPFVAGLGQMDYLRFIGFSFIGSVIWVVIFLGGGYLFGNIPFIKENLSLIILSVIFLSVIPIVSVVWGEVKGNILKKRK